jgi:hypothetical protein
MLNAFEARDSMAQQGVNDRKNYVNSVIPKRFPPKIALNL